MKYGYVTEALLPVYDRRQHADIPPVDNSLRHTSVFVETAISLESSNNVDRRQQQQRNVSERLRGYEQP